MNIETVLANVHLHLGELLAQLAQAGQEKAALEQRVADQQRMLEEQGERIAELTSEQAGECCG